MRDGRKKMAVFEEISPYELALATDPAEWISDIGTRRLYEEVLDLDLQFFLYLLGLLAEELDVPIETEVVVKKPDFDLNLRYQFKVVDTRVGKNREYMRAHCCFFLPTITL
jgi:hypothetical protein